jgi:enoyl-[acyl-carrier protein] reductase II
MLRTPVCDLLGMKVPIMQAAIWPATAPKLVAAVSEAGGLGSIGAVFESAESVQRQIARVREITSRPFAVNHVVPLLDEAAFRATSKRSQLSSLSLSGTREISSSERMMQGRR